MKVKNADELIGLGEKFGARLKGGETIELIGDVGAGKTTFVKGVAAALGVDPADVQSPSFTISRNYPARGGLILNHYDFYRLTDAGIMAREIAESLSDPRAITIVEWSDAVKSVLPPDRIVIRISYLAQSDGRAVEFSPPIF
ncbi:MAG: tRNA (adenosine(37)-N6)-threonylcarbamoyltransferase complex ATPase subunit type 1 TsaE [Candidatus Nomurabacteria bacterium]|jgi:tRNA threonylcarbamoyladenosine biosynthesis protein TsaE|nr:tRNA (adenosine(37)-N6)-threonylcarbamoyltransferase complex ATPase subunit type 1 TsaE [Candidatus Nomurabacteria bacterium]